MIQNGTCSELGTAPNEAATTSSSTNVRPSSNVSTTITVAVSSERGIL